MRRAVLLYNAQAGKCKIERYINQIVDIFQQANYEIQPLSIDFCTNPFDYRSAIDLVVVAGGDGTINYVLNDMMQRQLSVPMGVIPAGTANDFAGAIGMSRNELEAARQIAQGEIKSVDCGMVEWLEHGDRQLRYFVNIFSFGIFTTTSQHTPEKLKHRMGKIAYLVEGVKELRNIHAIPLTITADAKTFYLPTLLGLVFNGQTAGRIPLARESDLCDGEFDCIFLRKRTTIVSMFDMLLYMVGVKTSAVKCFRASELRLESPSTEATDVDGQCGGKFPMKVKCLHGALRVICPKN